MGHDACHACKLARREDFTNRFEDLVARFESTRETMERKLQHVDTSSSFVSSQQASLSLRCQRALEPIGLHKLKACRPRQSRR
eukprot:37747-Hanusia_phi.AAC.3